jgi:hypothetical protein
MSWAIEQPSFKHEIDKIILDYIDFGNCFATVEWVDHRTQQPTMTQAGYVGPAIRRVNPLDTVMNPIAEDFLSAPKFIRSIISMGELKEMLERMSTMRTVLNTKSFSTILKMSVTVPAPLKVIGANVIVYMQWMASLHSVHTYNQTTVKY